MSSSNGIGVRGEGDSLGLTRYRQRRTRSLTDGSAKPAQANDTELTRRVCAPLLLRPTVTPPRSLPAP